MKIIREIPAISDETRKKLRSHFDERFKAEHGDDLSSVVYEVSNDRDLFMFLAVHLPEKKGIIVGNRSYFDDIDVNVYYGLCLDMRIPRSTAIFGFRNTGHPNYNMQNDLRIQIRFPSWLIPGHGDIAALRPPSAKSFADEVNEVLSRPNIKDYIIDLQIKADK